MGVRRHYSAAELRQLEKDARKWRASACIARWVAGRGQRLIVGKELDEAAREFAAELPKPTPQKTGSLIAAAVRRWLRVGWAQVGLALLAIVAPQIVLVAQTRILSQQTQLLGEQNRAARDQAHFAQQQTTLLSEQNIFQERREYISSIYERSDCTDEEKLCPLDQPNCEHRTIGQCPPKADLRLRLEAACGYVKVQNLAQLPVFLDHSRIPWVIFTGCGSLAKAQLNRADLRCANFTDTVLDEADFQYADLRGAFGRPKSAENVTWDAAICPDGSSGSDAPCEFEESEPEDDLTLCDGRVRPPW